MLGAVFLLGAVTSFLPGVLGPAATGTGDIGEMLVQVGGNEELARACSSVW